MSIKEANIKMEEALDDGDLSRAGYYANIILGKECALSDEIQMAA